MEEEDKQEFKVVLPMQKPPKKLSHIQSTPVSSFLVGYRNVLVSGIDGVSWGLVKNNAFCGKAFVFELPQDDANHIQQIRDTGEMIEIVSNSYLLLKIQKEINNPTDPLTLEQLQKLLQSVGGVNKVNLNLVKNAFDSYKDYQQIAAKAVQELALSEAKEQLTVADKVKVQYNAKTMSGQALMQVPTVSKQTGNILGGQMLKLKI